LKEGKEEVDGCRYLVVVVVVVDDRERSGRKKQANKQKANKCKQEGIYCPPLGLLY
jgi:hypothetical protein